METKYFLQLICVILTARTALGAPQFPGQAEFQAATIRLAAINTLNYNDSCSFSDEQRRTTIGERMINMAYNMDFGQMSSIANDMDQLSRSGHHFCNAIKNLQCTSAGHCDCANGDFMGMKVRSVREQNVCRLAAGSACAPTSSLQSVGTQKPDLRCQSGSECTLISTKSPCTEAGMQNELMESYGGAEAVQRNPQGLLRHTKKKMEEGICVCSGGPPTGSGGLISITSLVFGLIILGLSRFNSY